jgi:phosphoglycolate phosphatase
MWTLRGWFDDKGLLIEHLIGVERIGPARTIMVRDRANDMLAASPCGFAPQAAVSKPQPHW